MEICTRELAVASVPYYALRMATTLAQNIRALREHLALTQTAFAKRIGVPQSYISKWENQDKVPEMPSLERLAELAGVTTKSFRDEPWGPQETTSRSTDSAAEAGHRSDRAEQPRTASVDAGETAQITRLDLSLPMGPGATVDDYVEEEPLEFDIAYLRSFTRTPPHRLRLASGAGDSMFPTLVSNDLVWVDTTQNQLLHSDRIYAASINGGAAIKRLRPIDGGRRVLVISDNKTVDPYEVDASEVRIWGRVIRFARDL